MTSDQAFVILGISNRNIDEAGLKKAFYEAARLTHPDSNPDDENAVHKFKMIKEAYALLGEYIRSDSFVASSKTADKGPSYKTKDKWDYYDEADKKFADERRRRAQQRAEQTMKRHAEYERMKYHESLRNEEERKNNPKSSEYDETINQEKQRYTASQEKVKLVLDSRWAWMGINLPVELAGFSVLAFVAIVELLLSAFGGENKPAGYAMNLAVIGWWIVSVQLGYYLMQFMTRYIKDKLVLGLVFLLAMEGGIGLYKVMGLMLNNINHSIVSLIMLIMALLAQLYNYSCIEENIKSDVDIRRNSSIMILIEMGISLFACLLFVILTFA